MSSGSKRALCVAGHAQPFVVLLLPTSIVAFQWYRPTILVWLVVLALTASGIAQSLPSTLWPALLDYPSHVLGYNALASAAFICMAIAGWPRRIPPGPRTPHG